jgi:hypothetical protein
MRLISNEELMAVGGGLGNGAERGAAMNEGAGEDSWWDRVTSWLGSLFGGGGSSSSSGVQTVIINGGKRFSNMTPDEQDALDVAIARSQNPGCSVTISRTNHGATVTVGINISASPGITPSYSQQAPSVTRTVICPP